MTNIPRRAFVKGAALGTFAFTIGGTTQMLTAGQARAQGVPLRVLKANEADAIEALGETLVPGAQKAGIAHFIDHQIAVHPEINPFDAALALLALAKLGAPPASFSPALNCIARHFGEGRFGAPFKAYEWNKMKTPTRILVGGPEVTSAFVLSAPAHARRAAGPR